MKFSIITAISFIAVTASAQALSECGQGCIARMLAKAESLGCPNKADNSPDAACLCQNPDFANGVRDCGNEACGKEDGASIIAYGQVYCSGGATSVIGASSGTAVVTVTSATATATVSTTKLSSGAAATSGATASSSEGSGSASGSGAEGGPVAISTIAVVTGIVSGSSTVLSTVGSSTIYSSESGATPISTAAVETVITTDGSAITSTIGSSTIYGAGKAESGSAISTEPIVSTVSSGSSTFVTTVGSSTISSTAPKATSSGGSGSGSGASSSSSSAGGAKQTAAAGFMALAGLAALVV